MFLIVFIPILIVLIVLNAHNVFFIYFCTRKPVSASETIGVLLS